MAIVPVIKEIITEAYRASDPTTISETNIDGHGKSFTMKRQIENKLGFPYVLLRFDTNPATLFPYFVDGHDLRRMCDYILFADRNEVGWCLLIELKKGKDDAMPQLNAGEAFARFLIEAAERVKKDVVSSKVQFRKIRVAEYSQLRKHQKVVIPEYDANHYINLQSEVLQLRHLLR